MNNELCLRCHLWWATHNMVNPLGKVVKRASNIHSPRAMFPSHQNIFLVLQVSDGQENYMKSFQKTKQQSKAEENKTYLNNGWIQIRKEGSDLFSSPDYSWYCKACGLYHVQEAGLCNWVTSPCTDVLD